MIKGIYILVWSIINNGVVVSSFSGSPYPKQGRNGLPLLTSRLNPTNRGSSPILHATSSDDGEHFNFESIHPVRFSL